MEDFSLLDEFRHRFSHGFRFYVRVYAVLDVEVDVVGLQTGQRTFHRPAYRLWRRIGNDGPRPRHATVHRDTELSGKHHLVAIGFQSGSD